MCVHRLPFKFWIGRIFVFEKHFLLSSLLKMVELCNPKENNQDCLINRKSYRTAFIWKTFFVWQCRSQINDISQ